MTEDEVDRWFAAYLADFVALCRGDHSDTRRILAYYGVPLLLGSDAGTVSLTSEDQVLDAAQRQIDDLRAAGYDRSDELAAETVVLNRTCATRRGRFVRRRADGSDIAEVDATYLIAAGSTGVRIVAIVLRSPA